VQGDSEIIEHLNEVLTAELTAVNQYFVHAKMLKNWGYLRLAEHYQHESIDEMKHADVLIDRILYFDGVPNMQRYFALTVGETVPEQFANDLELEKKAIERLNRGIALATAKSDNATRALLEGILVSEEEHADWLETQLNLLQQLGEAHYLSQYVHVED
jgi:bacterioferritin